MLDCSLAKRWLNWVSTTLAFPERRMHSYCRSWLLVLSSLIAYVDDTLTRIFEWESRILSVSPCGVYMARESAIVIIGGGDSKSCAAIRHIRVSICAIFIGLGQTMALNFSEHGHTVFVLYPNSTPGSSSTSAQCETANTKSSNVSSVGLLTRFIPRTFILIDSQAPLRMAQKEREIHSHILGYRRAHLI